MSEPSSFQPAGHAAAAPAWCIEVADPLGADATALLHEAALEARELYPEIRGAPWPKNVPTPPRGIYLVARTAAGGEALAMAAHQPIDDEASEVRRVFVRRVARRSGVARALLQAIEAHATAQGFRRLLLETGERQQPAMRLYESLGFSRIAPFGRYAADPTSVCYAKELGPGPPAAAG